MSEPLLGAQTPRIEHVPLFHTTMADDAVDLASYAGLYLDEWQEHVLRGSLAIRRDQKWAAFEVGLMVPRQNGKGSIIEARELAGLFLFGESQIIHTAHEFKTSIEGFRRIEKLIRDTPDLAKEVKGYKGDPSGQMSGIKTGNGFQSIELANGQRLQFLARSTGSGRGFTGDLVILDEAYALKPLQKDAILPVLSARTVEHNPQLWYTSSAGMPESEVLWELRERGMSDDAGRLYYAEWSVDENADGYDPGDPAQWAVANPALGRRISPEAIENEFRSMDAEGFGRERLGVWAKVGGTSVFPTGTFEACGPQDDEEYEAGDIFALAVDVQPDRSTTTITAASFLEDERIHLEIIEHMNGTDWVIDAVKAIQGSSNKPVAIAIDGSGAASSLLPEFRAAHIRVMTLSAKEVAQGCGRFFDLVLQQIIAHNADEALLEAVEACRRSPMGEGMWRWSRKNSLADISPLCAATVAVHALEKRGRFRLSAKKSPQGGRKIRFR